MNAIQFFVPDTLQENTDDYRKARTFVRGLLISLLCCLLYIPVYGSADYRWAVYTLIANCLMMVVVAFIFKATHSFLLAGHLFVACVFFTLLSFLSTSGAIVIASCWLVLCPMFAFLYISKSAGYTWAAITITAVATLQIAQLLQYEFPVLLEGKWVARLEIGASVGIIIVVVAVVVTYEAERDKLLRQLRKSHKDISEQNQEITQQNEEIRQQQEEIMTINENLEGEKKKLVEAHDLIQATNKNVTDSIRYASTIQQAILPDQNHMGKIFSDLFVLYKPKDIVSGDFYWMTQVDGKKVIAVCDCTGHGVPGAFMSMIGAMLLTEIVSKQEVTDPAQILELLDSSVRKRLNQREGNNKDGMDVCLCVIEEQGEKVQISFAGAKRDLYYYTAQSLGLLKGDRRTIGGFMISNENFTKVTLSLNKDDILYLSTDGLFDQANQEREKFGSRRFREFVALYKQESMLQQSALLDHMLRQHQRDTPQRDDITLIGIKL